MTLSNYEFINEKIDIFSAKKFLNSNSKNYSEKMFFNKVAIKKDRKVSGSDATSISDLSLSMCYRV